MTLVAFVAFCFAASSGYILNDLVDKSEDQTHPLKALRPLASGAVTVEMAVIVLGSLLAVALSIAYAVGSKFFVLVVAAAEVVVGLAIIVAIMRRRNEATADDLSVLRG